MMGPVVVKEYTAPPDSRREIWRYAGLTQEGPREAALLAECLSELEGRLSYRACWCECPVTLLDQEVDLGFVRVNSTRLAAHLSGCFKAVVFAATVGAELDRLVARYSTVSPAKALFFDTIGTARVEALCDAVCADLEREYEAKGFVLRPRFSPGYGDLALSLQRDIFALLDCPRKIGVSLGAELLMTPSKSVTAIVGVAYENN